MAAWTVRLSPSISKISLSCFQKIYSQRMQSTLSKCALKYSSPSVMCPKFYCRYLDKTSCRHIYQSVLFGHVNKSSASIRNISLLLKINSRERCKALSVNGFRQFSTSSRNYLNPGAPKRMTKKDKNVLNYILAALVFMLGGAYAGVPLYKVFCQATGLGGQATQGHDTSKIEDMEVVDRLIKVRFNADTYASMRWSFKPQQYEITVAPGETALAFYTAKNPTEKPIIGISTYNVTPVEAGQYFNKIQCFCFEEQRLNPKEQVDMPVFFYIDPEYAEDPNLEYCDEITLSYTFFEAKEGMSLPLPGYPQPHNTVAA